MAFLLLVMSGYAWGQSYHDNKWYSLYDSISYNKSTAAAQTFATLDVFAPTDGNVYLDTYMTVYQVGSSKGKYPGAYKISVGDAQVSISENDAKSVITESSSGKIFKTYSYSYSWLTNKSATGIGTNVSSVKVEYEYSFGNTLRTVYVRNIKIPLARHILLKNNSEYGTSSVSHAFESTTINNSTAYTVDFRSFLTSGNITVKLTSGDKDVFRLGSTSNTTGEITSSKFGKTYKVGNNACASANGAAGACSTGVLGKIDNYSFDVYFCPKAATTYTGTITISDGTKSATISLSGTGEKMTPEIVWSSDEEMFNEDDELIATNANGLTVTVSSAGNESFVHCDGNTAIMLAPTSGKITISANVVGNALYKDKVYTKQITITSLQKQYINWSQPLSHLKTTDANKSIKLDATTTANLPVNYELVGDQTGLTLSQSGDIWTLTYSDEACKNTTIIAKQDGNSIYAPAMSVSLPIKVVDPTHVCATDETLINKTITLKNTYYSQAIEVPDTMTIDVSRTKQDWYVIYSNGLKVQFYDDTKAAGKKLKEYSYDAGDINKSATLTISDLKVEYKSVKIVSEASNGYNLNSVTYTKQKYCTISDASLAFTTNPNTTTDAKSIIVTYANYPISLSCSNPKFTFTPTEFGDCGAFGNQQVAITYTADEQEGEDIGYLNVLDNTGQVLQTCTLNVTVAKIPQHITATNIGSHYVTTDIVSLHSEASSGLSNFTYSATPEGIVAFDGSEMTFLKSGVVDITVTENGSVSYGKAISTISGVRIDKVKPIIVANPDVAELHYLDMLRNEQLSSGSAVVRFHNVDNTSVSGAFVWANPMQITDVPGVHDYAVTFLPSDSGRYASNTFTIPVTVHKAQSSIELADGSLDVSVPGNEAVLDIVTLITNQVGDGDVTYQVISTNAQDATLSSISHFKAEAAGIYSIRAIKEQTDYYTQSSADFLIMVNRLQPDVNLSAVTTTAIQYGQSLADITIGGSVSILSTTPEVQESAHSSCVWLSSDSHPAVGTTTAMAVFTPSADRWFEPIEVEVPITVTPSAAKTYAATATIVEGQTLAEAVFVNNTIGLFDESVAGDIHWANTVDPNMAPAVNTYELPIRFESNDSNYAGGTGICHLIVEAGLVFDGLNTSWDNWLTEANLIGNERVTISADVTISSDVTIGGLTINEGNTLTIKDGGVLTVGEYNSLLRENYGNIVVEAGGKLILNGGNVQLSEFTLQSGYTAGQPIAGQVKGQSKIKTNNAYFVVDLDPSGVAGYGWYTFTVPFAVDALRGITRWENGEWMSLTNEYHYAIMAYNEGLRAHTQNGWKKFTGILQPGVGYTMTPGNEVNTYRFAMVSGGEIVDSPSERELSFTSEGDLTDRGWNCIGNGSMEYVDLAGAPLGVVQMYDHSTNTYTGVETSAHAFVVGAAYFVQAAGENTSVAMNATDDSKLLMRAPQRSTDTDCRVSLSLSAQGSHQDLLLVTCDDDALPVYTLGKDIRKLGATTGINKPRMWAEAKGTQLCAVNVAFADEQVVVPIHLYAPATCEYTLALNNEPEAEVYLRRNGIIVWDMTLGAYTCDLLAGTDDSYELLITHRAPSIATDVESTDSSDATRGMIFAEKIIDNGQLFLLRNGDLYDAQGRKVTSR